MRRVNVPFGYIISFILLVFTPCEGATAPFDEIIAFGDSLSDVGNVAGVTVAGRSPVIYGYYEESHFSDDILWIERLASYWELPPRSTGRGMSNTLPSVPDGNTWAWGGSEAGSGLVQFPGITEPIPNLLSEIDQYLEYNTPNGKILYSIWAGADNLLIGGKFGPSSAKKAADAVMSAMQRLQAAGACNFLIFNMPKLGDTPFAKSNPKIKIAADIYTDSFNYYLGKRLKDFRKSRKLEVSNIYFVDIYKELALVYRTVKNGSTYTPSFIVPGPTVLINNVSDEALNYFKNTGTFPSDYLFWDDVHPTTQAHQVVAGLVLQSISKGIRKK